MSIRSSDDNPSSPPEGSVVGGRRILSSRLPDRLQKTAFAEAFDDALDDQTVDLRTSNPTTVGLDAREQCVEALKDANRRESFDHYDPDPAGKLPARRAISRYYAKRGADVALEDICLCASTSEAYTWLAKMLGEPGEAFAVPAPSYPLFEHLLRVESLRAEAYPLDYNGTWTTRPDRLRRVCRREDVRAVIDVSPNNPTGHRLRGESLEAAADILADTQTPLIVDEVFLDYGRGDTQPQQSILSHLQTYDTDDRPRTFILSGLSKVAGLPGAKLGWLVIDGPDAWRSMIRRGLHFIADTFLSVTTASQLAVPDVLEAANSFQHELNRRLANHQTRIRSLIRDTSVASCRSGEYGWYELIRLPNTVQSGELAVKLADEFGVATQPGFLYDLPETTLVASLLPDPEAFREGIERLQTGLHDVYEA